MLSDFTKSKNHLLLQTNKILKTRLKSNTE